jgi:hypothetical protein
MNLERLSKNAESYSSASTTKNLPPPSRALAANPLGTPPMRKPGASPACSSIHATMVVVVVLPCVPATAITWRSRNTCSASQAGPDV